MEFCSGSVSLFHKRRHATTAAFRSTSGTIILNSAQMFRGEQLRRGLAFMSGLNTSLSQLHSWRYEHTSATCDLHTASCYNFVHARVWRMDPHLHDSERPHQIPQTFTARSSHRRFKLASESDSGSYPRYISQSQVFRASPTSRVLDPEP